MHSEAGAEGGNLNGMPDNALSLCQPPGHLDGLDVLICECLIDAGMFPFRFVFWFPYRYPRGLIYRNSTRKSPQLNRLRDTLKPEA
jgi:hypothetical protein